MNDRPEVKSDKIKQLTVSWGTMRYFFACTDTGNGRRFAYLYRDQLKYCYQHKAWYVWSHEYHRWRKAPADRLQHAVDDLTAHIWREVGRTTDNEYRRLRLIRWALLSNDPTWRRTTLEAAAGEPSLAIEPHEINSETQKNEQNIEKQSKSKNMAI